ncbi:uncharacterized protein LOC123319865 [Coccinella septempunctata]|uniref:uncharacterized protein LOC123319865 n=1 Tax=Coccinella septempunctata TaxID=41139 RepID=UPI001D085EA6|nr:uncharacterized protein LOC123319865 [Coccinella septempunctata]
MKNLLVFIGVLIVCVNAEDDYGTIEEVEEDSPADKIKDHPDKCYVENIGLIDKGSEVKVSGKCESIQCLDGGKYRVKKCDEVTMEWPCYTINRERPFPDCCEVSVECIDLPTRPTPIPPKRN